MKPTLNINLFKLKHNAEHLVNLCGKYNIEVAFVTKVFSADSRMVEVLINSNCAYLADSRVENITFYPKSSLQTMMLRLPTVSDVNEVVNNCDISLNSSNNVIIALNKAAKAANKVHKIILMIDLGDLREGIMYNDTAAIDSFVSLALSLSNIKLIGIGTNLTCYGSVIPTTTNANQLVQVAKYIEIKYNINLQIISGGNSSSLYLMQQGLLPRQINNLRLGESLVLGVETAYCKKINGMYDDVVTISAEVIEAFNKPSHPIGEIGVNAFGEKIVYQDKGIMKRLILSMGRQDVDSDGLTPLDDKLQIIGSSSDHLIIDATDTQYKVGDIITFKLNYSATLRAFTSKYVQRKYI